jgi:hypothetical protein
LFYVAKGWRARNKLLKDIVYQNYGSPDVVTCEEVETPRAGNVFAYRPAVYQNEEKD